MLTSDDAVGELAAAPESAAAMAPTPHCRRWRNRSRPSASTVPPSPSSQREQEGAESRAVAIGDPQPRRRSRGTPSGRRGTGHRVERRSRCRVESSRVRDGVGIEKRIVFFIYPVIAPTTLQLGPCLVSQNARLVEAVVRKSRLLPLF
jgi:hypothetical protein